MFGSLVKKHLRKHGWPAELCEGLISNGFSIGFVVSDSQILQFDEMPNDFSAAVESCTRNLANQHKIDLTVFFGDVHFLKQYTVVDGGFIRPCLRPDGRHCVCTSDADFICSRKKWSVK